MTDTENKYLSGISNINSRQNLIDYSIQFIQDELGSDDFFIIQHQMYPDPYELKYPEKSTIDLKHIQDEILQLGDDLSGNNQIDGQQYNYFFFDSVFSSGIGEIYLTKIPLTNELKSILHIWNHQESIIQKFMQAKEFEIKETQASLVSQLMHDVQAIIDLSANSEQNSQLTKRIEYQKKVNKNYLFWIRDCELLKTKVSPGELIRSSLQIIGIDNNSLDLITHSDKKDISVDVELFSMALNEIVLNAVTAVDNKLSKIRITISQYPCVSPFFKKSWTIIEVRDTGPGIPEDFLPFIANPFFTTRKKEGASGFGIPVAKKIIEAHQGCLEIKSTAGMGTIVKLIIPG